MIRYRAPTARDAPALAALAEETFVETFGSLYAPEDLALFLAENKTPEVWAAKIADPKHEIRIAEDGAALVGYCAVAADPTFTDYAPVNRSLIELKELYVRSSVQGKGVAAALMAWALDIAKGSDADEMVLSVWSRNERAKRFYTKYDFKWVADTYFMVGNHRDDEFLFMRPMKAGSEPEQGSANVPLV